jgi:hypothetical protein
MKIKLRVICHDHTSPLFNDLVLSLQSAEELVKTMGPIWDIDTGLTCFEVLKSDWFAVGTWFTLDEWYTRNM